MVKRQQTLQGGSAPKKALVEAEKEEDVELQEAMQKQREITFGKKLGAPDKTTRDRGVRKLKTWLSKQNNLTPLDNRKVWKGLFYCMWLCDKPLIQEELAENLGNCILQFPSSAAALRFVEAFFAVLGKEWHGLDRLRLDKFFFLIKTMLSKTFALLAAHEWEESVIESFCTLLSEGPLAPNSDYPKGIAWYIFENFVGELAPIASEDDDHFTSDHLNRLLEPFCLVLAADNDKWTLDKVIEEVFQPLVTKETEQLNNMIDGDEDDDEEENDNYMEVNWAYLSEYVLALAKRKDLAVENRSRMYALKRMLDDVQVKLQEFLKKSRDAGLIEGASDEDEEMEEGEEEEGDGEEMDEDEDEEEEEEEDEEEEEEEVIIKKAPTPSKQVKSPVPTPSKQTKSPVPTPSKQVKSPVPTPSKQVKSPVPTPSKQVKSPVPTPSKQVKSPVPTPSKQVKSPVPTPSKQAKCPVPTPSKQAKTPSPAKPTPSPQGSSGKPKKQQATPSPSIKPSPKGTPKASPHPKGEVKTPSPHRKPTFTTPVKGSLHTPPSKERTVNVPGSDTSSSKKKVSIVLQNNMIKEFDKLKRITTPNGPTVHDPARQPSSSALKKVSAYERTPGAAERKRKSPSNTPVKHGLRWK